MVSTKACQSVAASSRRLVMLLLMETWSAACCWFSDCTSWAVDRPNSDSRCSIQCSGMARLALCPCSRRTSSATKALLMGGSDRAMSATTRIRLLGSFCATCVMRLAQ